MSLCPDTRIISWIPTKVVGREEAGAYRMSRMQIAAIEGTASRRRGFFSGVVLGIACITAPRTGNLISTVFNVGSNHFNFHSSRHTLYNPHATHRH
jgi:hypothetical protein